MQSRAVAGAGAPACHRGGYPPLPQTTKWLAGYIRVLAALHPGSAATTRAHRRVLCGSENHTCRDQIASNTNFRDQLKKFCVSPPKGVILWGHHSNKIQSQSKPFWYKLCYWSDKKGIYFQCRTLEGIPHVLASVNYLFQYITEIVLLHWNTSDKRRGPRLSSIFSSYLLLSHSCSQVYSFLCSTNCIPLPLRKKKALLVLNWRWKYCHIFH